MNTYNFLKRNILTLCMSVNGRFHYVNSNVDYDDNHKYMYKQSTVRKYLAFSCIRNDSAGWQS